MGVGWRVWWKFSDPSIQIFIFHLWACVRLSVRPCVRYLLWNTKMFTKMSYLTKFLKNKLLAAMSRYIRAFFQIYFFKLFFSWNEIFFFFFCSMCHTLKALPYKTFLLSLKHKNVHQNVLPYKIFEKKNNYFFRNLFFKLFFFWSKIFFFFFCSMCHTLTDLTLEKKVEKSFLT